MRRVRNNRYIKFSKTCLEDTGVKLLHLTFFGGFFEVLNGCPGTSNNGRRKRCSEDESRRIRSNHIDQPRGCGNVSTNKTKGFTQRTGNNVNLVKNGPIITVWMVGIQFKIQVFSYPSAAGTIHS